MKICRFLNVVLILISFCKVFSQQTATISEKLQAIDTYYFDRPNPTPILVDNPKIYPYFKFEGYQQQAKKRDWKVITLENDYIKLFVLPEVGGKIWGAIEKKTGEEFLYKNEVLKFRNIAMRGPWTSGGIEFNFGIIGHTPNTATPVDYTIKNNDDGSVSCIVGTIDLPSRTVWRVEINLQKNKAYFETKASWYNATPLNQSYYNWMTAAAKATNDLKLFIPGNQYLKHNGKAESWPFDEQNRDLSFYKNNNFGSHKSYHVVGDYKNFFGGYYHKTKFGFGHWASYEEMPGQKLWLWALSKSGGIWEDLLTDTDGQYIEFQAGRLFNQYSSSNFKTPITQANFEPYVMDKWTDIWFPFKEINGMVDASKYGVLNVEHKNNNLYVGVNALQILNENIKVIYNDSVILNENFTLKPMEVFSKNISLNQTGKLEVFVGDKLHYTNKKETLIKRPFKSDLNLKISSSQQLYKEGWEALKYREYDKSFQKLTELIEIDPSHQNSLIKLAELAYRKTDYHKGIEYVNRVLKMDTYDADANYMAGILYRAIHDDINALESLGWSARSVKYRSVSYAQMAEIYLSQDNLFLANEYAYKALDYNTYNINTRQVLLIVARKQKNLEIFKLHADELLTIDPLHHFVTLETNFIHDKNLKIENIQNEFSAETILELALNYYNLGLHEEALSVLQLKSEDTKVKLWLSYLLKDSDVLKSNALLKGVVETSPDFVFPYRRETIKVLEWASKKNKHWKFYYYLAQNYLAINKKEKGKQFLTKCNNDPDFPSFYIFRAKVIDNDYSTQLKDYQNAIQLKNDNPIIWNDFIQFSLKNSNFNISYTIAKKAYKRFPKNYDIALGYCKALIQVKKYKKCLSILKNIQVLPSELSRNSRVIYYEASVLLANQFIQQHNYSKAIPILENSKEWPKNLGVGKPYDSDTRLPDYLLAICYEKLNNTREKLKKLNAIVNYTNSHLKSSSLNHLFGLLSLKKMANKKSINIVLNSINVKKDKKNQLVIAFYNMNKTELTKIKPEQIISNEFWSLLKNALMY